MFRKKTHVRLPPRTELENDKYADMLWPNPRMCCTCAYIFLGGHFYQNRKHARSGSFAPWPKGILSWPKRLGVGLMGKTWGYTLTLLTREPAALPLAYFENCPERWTFCLMLKFSHEVRFYSDVMLKVSKLDLVKNPYFQWWQEWRLIGRAGVRCKGEPEVFLIAFNPPWITMQPLSFQGKCRVGYIR